MYLTVRKQKSLVSIYSTPTSSLALSMEKHSACPKGLYFTTAFFVPIPTCEKLKYFQMFHSKSHQSLKHRQHLFRHSKRDSLFGRLALRESNKTVFQHTTMNICPLGDRPSVAARSNDVNENVVRRRLLRIAMAAASLLTLSTAASVVTTQAHAFGSGSDHNDVMLLTTSSGEPFQMLQTPLEFEIDFASAMAREIFINITKGITPTTSTVRQPGAAFEGSNVRGSKNADWRLELNLTSSAPPLVVDDGQPQPSPPFTAVFAFMTPQTAAVTANRTAEEALLDPLWNFVGISRRMKNEANFRRRTAASLRSGYNILGWELTDGSVPRPPTYSALPQVPVPSPVVPMPANAKKYSGEDGSGSIAEDKKAVFSISLSFIADYYYTDPPSSSSLSSSPALAPWFAIGPNVNDYTQRLSALLFGAADVFGSPASARVNDTDVLGRYRADLQTAGPLPTASTAPLTVLVSRVPTTTTTTTTTTTATTTRATTAPPTTTTATTTTATTTAAPTTTTAGEPSTTTVEVATTTSNGGGAQRGFQQLAGDADNATTEETSTVDTATATTTETTTAEASTSTGTTTAATTTRTTTTRAPTTTTAPPPPAPPVAVVGYLPTVTATISFLSDEEALIRFNAEVSRRNKKAADDAEKEGTTPPIPTPAFVALPGPRIQEVFTLLSTPATRDRVVANLPGCLNITVLVPGGTGTTTSATEVGGGALPYTAIADRYTSQQRRDDGHDAYMDSKVGFMVAIIVIFVVSVVGFVGGHFYSLKVQSNRIMTESINDQYRVMKTGGF